MSIVNISGELVSLQVALEIWGVIICLGEILFAAVLESHPVLRNRILILLMCLDIVMVVADAYSRVLRGDMSLFGTIGLRVSNFLVFLMNYLIVAGFTLYLQMHFTPAQRTKCRGRVKVIMGIAAVMILLITVSQFTDLFYSFDEHNYYHRNERFFWITQVTGIICIFLEYSILIQFRKSLSVMQLIAFSSFLFLPVLALVIQIFVYGFSFLPLAMIVSSMLIFFNGVLEQRLALMEKEQELKEMQISMMLSQIQPHFIFNTLSTIRYLCRKNPEDAVSALDEFSAYLRTNLDSMGTRACIPFRDELQHVKTYIALEQWRFRGRVATEYHIEAEDFYIPALSLQPLVENAIKHGITKRMEGGTVVIRSWESRDGWEILVQDDGVGFDANEKKQDGRSHIGVQNVKDRISGMCGGTLTLQSVPEKGTTARIFIPKDAAKRFPEYHPQSE
ncbi:MAG: sensor histidine kinase [Anaerovoracaceae bacterium]